ncbi:MAG: T9SS type A sorting domain-containing protein [Flavobacteriales bacterium]|jgi:hypothetical protein|nr:T9SS type A sorting domain-containing protein [Flavobacteriales bacterium]
MFIGTKETTFSQGLPKETLSHEPQMVTAREKYRLSYLGDHDLFPSTPINTMKNLSTLLSIASLTGLSLGATAQITVQDSLSNSAIAQLLEGLNVTISNVQVNCAGAAMGHFSGPSELAISEGLVLTTGAAQAVAGPVDAFATTVVNLPGDPDLEADAGFITYDACVLEFDCIPAGDTLLFNFSFGSEEYPEFVGSGFNDIFAIYLSGPDIPFPVNVAQLPDGSPVAINNVNTLNNSGFFHDNEAFSGQFVSYDGFTDNLTAFAEVHPGEAYHFKVAIADASDMIFDSGVFLEAFSFRSVDMATGITSTLSATLGITQQGGSVTVSLPAGIGAGEMLVYDAMGRVVKQAAVTGRVVSFDVSALPTGAYTVRLLNGGGVLPARFVKQ